MNPPPARRVLITGAGSGVGRATASLFAHAGWTVALLGRNREKLDETAQALPSCTTIWTCDLTDPVSIHDTATGFLTELGAPQVLVNAAGINIPQRSWGDLSCSDFDAVIAANFTGVFHLVRAFLPAWRAQGGATVVNVNSEAGLQANAKAGVSYVTSKFALHGLTQSPNAEGRENGIRACSLFPGDIDTPLLEKRPVVPSATQRKTMLTAEDVAHCIYFIATRPPHAVVEEMTLRPMR